MNAEQIAQNHLTVRKRSRIFFDVRPAMYITIILTVVVMTYCYKLRADGIFSCPASEYGTNWYLAYCHTPGYGDFEHGAFWYALKPGILQAAGKANILILGNSRAQVALSTQATSDWFASAAASFYLTGFSYHEKSLFTREILKKINPRARAYIINVDDFFMNKETAPAKTVMHDPTARLRYAIKHLAQFSHKWLCRGLPALCGDRYVVFRSVDTGTYRVSGLGNFKSGEVIYNFDVDRTAANDQARIGLAFIAELPVRRDCIVLTMIPTEDTKIGTARSIAHGMGMELVAPLLDGLQTFDKSHLDQESAERWAKAFFEAAAPRIRACLDQNSQVRL